VELDLLGNHSLVSDSGTILDFSVYHGIFNALNLKGKRLSALSAFALAAGRIPWAENQRIGWKDEPSLSVVMNPLWQNLTLFLIPFFKPIRVRSSSVLFAENALLHLESSTQLSVLGMRIGGCTAKLILSRKDGIKEINLFRQKERILHATHMLQGAKR
jgi:hypothetical protein